MVKIKIIHVKPILSDREVEELEGTVLPNNYYKTILKEDADVYKEDGTLLLKYRKGVLPQKNIISAYKNMIEHARKLTTTRGMTGGNTGKKKLVIYNNKIASNIMGYFDTLSLQQKYIFRLAKMEKPLCREASFNQRNPEKWKKIIPLIKDIDRQYKKLFPKHHKIQLKEAQKTPFVIDDTAFTTITTNLNLQTACHYDKGDFSKGFGNLVVIEKGKYKGGYTGFPKYGIAVDVRTGDFLGMDVHLIHGNTPIIKLDKDAERLSLVSYLRENIPKKCANIKFRGRDYFEKAMLKARIAKSKMKTKKKKTSNKKKSFKNKKGYFF